MLFVLASAEPTGQPVSIQTALLIIFGLGLLWTVRSLLDLRRRVDRLTAALEAKRRPSVPSAVATIPPEIVVVITAAVHEALDDDHRVVSITAEHHNPAWSMEGRRQIFGSRKGR